MGATTEEAVILIFKVSRKVAEVMFVTRRIWASASVWLTLRSSLRGWNAERRPGGFRIITPLLGLGVCASAGNSGENREGEVENL